MGDSNESLLKAVRHYQDSLDRHTENRNENKLLHYLDRLYRLSIKVVHLEQTGVGRTVNGLRKLGGEVGESARRLVTKWKEMVVGEQEEEDEEDEEDGYQTGEDQSSDGDSKNHEVEKVRENSSSHRKSDKSHNGTDDKDKVRKSKDNSSKSSRSSESKSSSEKDRHRENGHERHKSHKRKAESSSEDESPKKKRYEDDNRHKKRVESDSEDEKRSRDKQHKKSEKKKHRESSDDESEVETKSKERRHKSDKRKTRELSDDDSDDESRSREKRKSDKYKSLDRPSTSKDTHRDKHKHSKKDDSKRHEHSSKTKESEKKSKHKSEEKERVRDKSDDRKEKKKVVNGSLTKTGIDSGSGTSFAEALGMCEPSSSKGSTTTTKKPPKAPEKKDKPTIKLDDSVPKLLKDPSIVNIANIEPLDLNISSLLPPITPNYRPLGNLISSDSQAKKWLSESEALTNSITSKNQRTKVYSGNKVAFGKVPSLFELCTRILQDNIDALEYTGGVPYLILKPILEKATPNQLYVMEHHNPYLIEDTDELWQLHCQKEFRNKHREELEAWREMYLRCLDERDAKLKALTANIKQSQDKSLPVRTTKLAYVDAVAKPPRNIARKQAKNGTAFDIRKPAMTPTARLNSLATAGEAGKVAVPNPGSRAVERTSGHGHSAKPKKAPLMLKSISSFKNRFKR